MKTQIIGFDNERGHGKSVLIASADVPPAAQVQIMQDAKQRHKFPDNIRLLRLQKVEDIETAVFISTNLGEQLAAAEAKREADAQAAAERAAAQQKQAEALASAQAKVSSTAAARNQLLGELHQAESKLRNHDLTPKELRSASHDEAVAKANVLLFGDPKKKVAGLKDQVAAAVKAYDDAVAALAELTKPKTK